MSNSSITVNNNNKEQSPSTTTSPPAHLPFNFSECIKYLAAQHAAEMEHLAKKEVTPGIHYYFISTEIKHSY
ncbi:hypothetical protein PSTT_09595 [Puccinia striiformis]|uniref:Uncharacterized protein n=1 Tax=Puccinia striiformis TaxID=27350 RepID=A0A2S4V7Q0_9BASI|nr:hypothetical protein PSTT_09595 [Puccinia striiformis]